MAVDPSSLQPTSGGFLAGNVHPTNHSAFKIILSTEEGIWAGGIAPGDSKVVCVVGLAHANGAIDQCAERLRSVTNMVVNACALENFCTNWSFFCLRGQKPLEVKKKELEFATMFWSVSAIFKSGVKA